MVVNGYWVELGNFNAPMSWENGDLSLNSNVGGYYGDTERGY